MSATDRRSLLRMAAAAMALPMLPSLARAATPLRFAPPAAPMRYTRRLERGLSDGASFVVGRSFSVRFVADGAGYRVEGEQIDVEVEAPEALAAFVAIERDRIERGLFPLRLAADGTIAEGAGTPLATKLDAAVREALAQLQARPGGTAERAELVRFVNAFHQGAGKLMTELPRDLFAPGDPRRESHAIALPGGDTGEVTIAFTAARDPATGLMREAMREMVTALEQDRRRTLESWQLRPLS